MTEDPVIGRRWTLTLQHIGPPGAFLGPWPPDAGSDAVVLLPKNEVPAGADVGDELEVFVYLDSEERPVASTQRSKLEMGEVAFLQVVACSEFGAFVDWGLPKQLLVPFAKQTKALAVGDCEPIGLYLDSSGRLAGTMRVTEMLTYGGSQFDLDEWVEGEAWRNDAEIGLFVIVERQFVGLVPKQEPHSLSRGQAARFRVANRLPDGKMVLSLRGHAHEELERDAQTILSVLAAANPPRVSDASHPEDIRKLFGMSKKAFKRAVGSLLKRRLIQLDRDGYAMLMPSKSQ